MGKEGEGTGREGEGRGPAGRGGEGEEGLCGGAAAHRRQRRDAEGEAEGRAVRGGGEGPALARE